MIQEGAHTQTQGSHFLPSNSEVLHTKDCESVSTIDILNYSRSENEPSSLKLTSQTLERVIIGQVNINSLLNKIELLKEIIRDKVDVLMILESKLDSFFPETQSYMESYPKPNRLDRSGQRGGIMLYAREEISSKLIPPVCGKFDKEYFLAEINLRRNKWLLVCNYNPHKILIKYFWHVSVKKQIHSQQNIFLYKVISTLNLLKNLWQLFFKYMT